MIDNISKWLLSVIVFIGLMSAGRVIVSNFQQPESAFIEQFGGMMSDCVEKDVIPPPAVCYASDSPMLRRMAIADLITAVCYLIIPGCLLVIVWGRVNVVLAFVAFLCGAFVLSCGNVHLQMVRTFWDVGNEYTLLYSKQVMAFFSAVTVAFLVVNLGYLRLFKSPETVITAKTKHLKELEEMQKKLQREKNEKETMLTVIEQYKAVFDNKAVLDMIQKQMDSGKIGNT